MNPGRLEDQEERIVRLEASIQFQENQLEQLKDENRAARRENNDAHARIASRLNDLANSYSEMSGIKKGKNRALMLWGTIVAATLAISAAFHGILEYVRSGLKGE